MASHTAPEPTYGRQMQTYLFSNSYITLSYLLLSSSSSSWSVFNYCMYWRSSELSEFFKPITFNTKGKVFPLPVIQVFQSPLSPAAYSRNGQPYLVPDEL